MSADLRLVIGERNLCPWSLRAWLILRQLGLEFEEVVVPLGWADTTERVLHHSPSGRLPVLVAGEIRVWDALAIAEFLADHFVSLWPTGAEARAVARSVSAEMHGGLRELQVFLPMDFTARFAPPGRLLTPVAADVRRVAEIWTTCRTGFGGNGPFLFGEFTIADAMFAPVCAAFTTHGIALDDLCRAYVEHMTGLPAMLEWAEAARTGSAVGTEGPAPPSHPPISPAPSPAITPGPAAAPPAAIARTAPSFLETFPPAPRAAAPTAPAPPAPPPAPGWYPAVAVGAGAPHPAARPGPVHAVPEHDEDGHEPAPGLPGVVPTRPYDADDEEEERAARERLNATVAAAPAAAAAAEEDQPRRVVRPPAAAGGGLFRWRQPRALERAAGAGGEEPDAGPAPVPPPAAVPPPAVPAFRPPPPMPVVGAAVPPAPAIPAARAQTTIKPIGDGIRRRR